MFLSYGIAFSTSLQHVCSGLLDEKQTSRAAILLVTQDYALGLNMALYVVVFAYLANWYIQIRIERLAGST